MIDQVDMERQKSSPEDQRLTMADGQQLLGEMKRLHVRMAFSYSIISLVGIVICVLLFMAIKDIIPRLLLASNVLFFAILIYGAVLSIRAGLQLENEYAGHTEDLGKLEEELMKTILNQLMSYALFHSFELITSTVIYILCFTIAVGKILTFLVTLFDGQPELVYYLVYLIFTITLAYWPHKLLAITVSIRNRLVKDWQPVVDLAYSRIRRVNFRQTAYFLVAGLYFAANLERFGGFRLLQFEWWQSIMSVTLEVLLTFVSVDACAQLFKKGTGEGSGPAGLP